MRRVLHLRSSASIAGPERHLLELANRLPFEGYEMEVALLYRRPAGGTPLHPLLAELEGRVARCWQIDDPDRAGGAAQRTLSRRLAEGGVDLLHSHDPKANWVSRIAAAQRTPRVATLHLHTRATAALRWHARIDRWMLRRFDRLIAVAAAAGARVRDRRGVGPRFIANGIDARSLVDRVRESGSVPLPFPVGPGGSPALLAAGRLVSQKGFDVLLRALAILRERRADLSLAVAGEGPERATLEALADRLGLSSRVSWLGERRDLPRLMASSSAFVLPSRHEGSPFVVLEAMALERPIVASAVGGVVDLLDGGAAGRLVPPEDPEALAGALLEIVESPGSSRERSRRALALLETRFSAARMAAETAGVYRELVA